MSITKQLWPRVFKLFGTYDDHDGMTLLSEPGILLPKLEVSFSLLQRTA